MVQTTLMGRDDPGPSYYSEATTKNNFDGRYTADSVIVTLSTGLALYNCVEMVLLIATTFKRWRGLYFWSLTLCTFGVASYNLGVMLVYFDIGLLWLSKTINDVGWLVMIITQSLVLYSRLNLIFDNDRLLAAVKWMIICVSLFLPIPVVLDFGSTYSSNPNFARAYYYIEKIQMTGITVLELSISLLYVYKTVQLLRIISRVHMRSMIWQLFTLNVIIVAMDCAIVALQYRHYQLYQETVKGFVYSVKLKLELNILSKLVDIVHGDRSTDGRSLNLDVIDSNAIEGQAREEVRRELVDQQQTGQQHAGLSTLYGDGDEKKTPDLHITGESYRTPPLSPQSIDDDDDDDDNEISQIVSRQSNNSRIKGRESDAMYADMLRSMR